MSTSTSTSTQPNQQPTLQLPGYFYDPIKKRYFKGETKEKNVSTKSTQQDSKRQRPVQRRQSEKRKQRSISLRPNFDPELHPGSLADRQRYISLAGSKTFRKGRMRTKSIAYPNIRVQGGEFDPLRAIEIVVGPDGKRELFLGFSDSAILYGDLEDLIDPSTFNAENLGYHLGTHEDFDVELFPTANLEPISSIKFINGWFSVTRLNLSSTIKVDQEWASDPFNFNSFKTDSVVKDFWCSTLTSTHQLTGGEKGIVLKDLLTNQRRTVKTSQSIISLETLQDDRILLAGTRGGSTLLFDLRSPPSHKSKLSNTEYSASPIYYLKTIDFNQILVVGTGGYAKVNDLRWIGKRKEGCELMTLKGYRNEYDLFLGCDVYEGKEDGSRLVALAGSDRRIGIYNLSSLPESSSRISKRITDETQHPGRVSTGNDVEDGDGGLRPIYQVAVNSKVHALKFYDDWPERPTRSNNGDRNDHNDDESVDQMIDEDCCVDHVKRGSWRSKSDRGRTFKGLGLLYGDRCDFSWTSFC